MKKRCIVFDWDGTLLDSKAVKRQSFCDAVASILVKHDISVNHQRLAREFDIETGRPRSIVVTHMLKSHSLDLTEAGIQLVCNDIRRRIELSFGSLKLFSDVEYSLSQLLQIGFLVSISSSVPHEELNSIVPRFLPSGMLGNIFPILGTKASSSKGTQHIKEICHFHSVQLDDITFVGDDEADLALALEAGVRFVKIERNCMSLESQADSRIRGIRSLKELISGSLTDGHFVC
jgi:phosphoglycolate phosphatase-like HAD superfamily hydrolase